jgi:hypothetical protein
MHWTNRHGSAEKVAQHNNSGVDLTRQDSQGRRVFVDWQNANNFIMLQGQPQARHNALF